MNKLMIRHTMDKPLPYDAEVEYLESTGTQYIDTGITCNTDTDVLTVTFSISSFVSFCGVAGYRVGASDHNFAIGYNQNNVMSADCNNSNYANSRAQIYDAVANTDYTIIISRQGRYIYKGDSLVDSNTSTSDIFTTGDIYVFAVNGIQNYSQIRVKNVQIERNGEEYMTLKPVRKGNTGYMYDKVSGRLFGNQGTGDFVVGPDYDPFAYQYLTFVPLEDSTFSFAKRGTGNDIEYSIDGGAWTALASEVNTPTVGAGHNIRWRAELVPSSLSTNEPGIGVFSSSSKFNIAGNVASLLFGDSFVGQPTLLKEASYYYLFSNSKVVDASAMALTIPLAKRNCYQGMFEGCALLTDAPELKYITANNDDIFHCMFRHCVSLVNAPRQVNANGWRSCASMFAGCTSLVVAPSLPATTLSSYCYRYMFLGCTSLRIAPVLPAASLGVNYCYQRMFEGCTSLDYVKCLATSITGSGTTSSWLLNVSPTGTFVKAAGMNDWTTGTSGIPNGWTVVDDPSTINS